MSQVRGNAEEAEKAGQIWDVFGRQSPCGFPAEWQ